MTTLRCGEFETVTMTGLPALVVRWWLAGVSGDCAWSRDAAVDCCLAWLLAGEAAMTVA